ncbi:hypothetical protein CPZ29_13140 [Klebsiella oxytoca]|nr:hypothetical protein HMPREF1569_4174 [Klebsiella oxytoca OK-1]PDO73783.1 hypothetical protein CPZ29_13140 [Klebsiella oxytoca]
MFQASFLLVSPSHYKMQLKSQVKLINDCQAISNAANFAWQPPSLAPRNTRIIIREFRLRREYFPPLFY